jgi:hypothetical protein
MPNKLQRIKKFLEDHSPEHYSLLLAAPVALLVVGFVIWNLYLYSFGFVVNELLRSQFILAGLFFLLITLALFGFLLDLHRLFNYFLRLLQTRFDFLKISSQDFEQFKNSAKPYLTIGLLVIWCSFYLTNVFPYVPLYLGGGQPRAISLLMEKESMPMLASLGISLAEGASYQTVNLCVVYEDSQRLHILMSNRIVVLDKSDVKGMISLPGLSSLMEQDCTELAAAWTHIGIASGLHLFSVNVENVFRTTFGFAPKRINMSDTQIACTPGP